LDQLSRRHTIPAFMGHMYLSAPGGSIFGGHFVFTSRRLQRARATFSRG
jgi:hypothetical protein